MRSPARSPVANSRGRAFDRHSGTGVRGLPKKKGAGKKGVWGAPMDQEAVFVLDRNDPNYDSEDEIDQLPYAPPRQISIRDPIPVPPLKQSGIESAASSLNDMPTPGAKPPASK